MTQHNGTHLLLLICHCEQFLGRRAMPFRHYSQNYCIQLTVAILKLGPPNFA